jgi:predicted nucleic acid-binding protein
MRKPLVYVETSVIGYLTSRPSRDPIIGGHQQSTKEWWGIASSHVQLVVSELVVVECAAGNEQAASERLHVIQALERVAPTEAAAKLTEALLLGKAVPSSEPRDAAHIALAASHGVEFLVTWNFRHIANIDCRAAIEWICREAGFEPPIICSPEALLRKDVGDVV